ncbi:MAG TPA: hypothetical protein DDZ76_07490, partial [Xanthomonadales bacterium]|nr:hypothetical protein [Xanthomonadales bacterium]
MRVGQGGWVVLRLAGRIRRVGAGCTTVIRANGQRVGVDRVERIAGGGADRSRLTGSVGVG